LTEFVKSRDISELKTSLDLAIQNQDFDEAETAVASFASVKLSDIEHLDLCRQPDKAYQVLRESLERTAGEGLFSFPGDLGQLTGPFQKGDLVAFAAPSKRGKTWWMQECGVLAAKAGKRAVIFSLEMSSGQLIARITRRLARRPRVPAMIQMPCFEENMLRHQEERFDACLHHLTEQQMASLYGKLSKDGGGLVLQAYPAFTASVSDLKSFLNYLETAHDYAADVVIIDYADIVRSEYKGDYRHQIDHTWKLLRSLAQERDCLVITATHTNKNTYTKNIKQADMSEDSRKMNHISCMIALNQTEGEKSSGILRASILASRHDNFSSEEEVVVLQCLDLACPCIDSRLKSEVHNYDDFKNGLFKPQNENKAVPVV
jgi:replicative DNA helicase